ncbi:hypothetical protein C7B77_05790 [Chamaesiphon polymorphus CCALA 037]|uniref:Uncharacterized protein n=2 Tax=Chamaesiphon TaxID=217161 RepID=A0A2T1GK83_9CYAN|nr:hypothetical protein C7B77_05790 [Chamaesiphon polymorphus CCALA 037]
MTYKFGDVILVPFPFTDGICQNVAVDEFSGDASISDDLDRDNFIPDPPDADNPSNFAYWVSSSDRSETQLQVQKSKSWWKIW